MGLNRFKADMAAVKLLHAQHSAQGTRPRNAPFSKSHLDRDALEFLLGDVMAQVSPQAVASILSDAVADLVASGKWSEADARTVLYTADRRIDRVVSQ